jgi:hypothetical protein
MPPSPRQLFVAPSFVSMLSTIPGLVFLGLLDACTSRVPSFLSFRFLQGLEVVN